MTIPQGGGSFVVPKSAEGTQTALVASAALAAAGAYTQAGPVSVKGVREITLLISYTPGAAGGYPIIVPLLSAQAADPDVDDDAWFAPAVDSGTVTATLLGGVATGADYTAQPEWGLATERPLAIRLEAGDAGTDKIRIAIPIRVAAARWFQIAYAEAGVTATPGTLAVDYVLSA